MVELRQSGDQAGIGPDTLKPWVIVGDPKFPSKFECLPVALKQDLRPSKPIGHRFNQDGVGELVGTIRYLQFITKNNGGSVEKSVSINYYCRWEVSPFLLRIRVEPCNGSVWRPRETVL